MNRAIITTANPLVVQHNAMVNAGFSMTALEMRCFIAMISRIGRDDTALPLCRISVKELCPDSSSKNVYQEVRAMVEKMASRFLLMEVLGPDGQRLKQPDLKLRPLMGAIDYLKHEGVVEAVFNEHLRPYLLELKNNFTKAQLSQVMKIKRPSSHRIYWLLREYASFGKRTVSVAELRQVLGLKDEYVDRFDHFRTRVLDPAQEELAATDLPFTYELLKEGRVITEIRFLFAPGEVPAAAELLPAEAWAQALLEVGVAAKSLVAVREKLAVGYYDEGYIQFVLVQVRAQVKAGKVKKEAGAVFKALTDGYLLPAYQKARQAPASAKVKASPALLAKRKKLLSNLEDALNSLEFVKTAVIYTDETRPEALERVQAIVTDLEQQLAQLNHA